MKNKILLLAACTAFVMTGSVKAQITVNSSQVNFYGNDVQIHSGTTIELGANVNIITQ